MRINLNKTTTEAKVLFTTDEKHFHAEVIHSSCSQTLQSKASWEISKAAVKLGVFGKFLSRPLTRHAEEIHLSQRRSRDSYLYISYVLRDSLDHRIIAYDYGYVLLLRPPPVVNITGVKRAIKGKGVVVLSTSAITTVSLRARLKYSWYCRRKEESFPVDDSHFVDVQDESSHNSGGCYGYGPGRLRGTKTYLNVDVDRMEAGLTYVFRAKVKRRSKTSTDDHYITVLMPTNFTVR